jgi:hypothetical protein
VRHSQLPIRYGGRSRKRFPLFGTSGFLLIRLLWFWTSLGTFGGFRGIDRLKSHYSGDRAPITLATLYRVATSPKKEVEISFCSVLRTAHVAQAQVPEYGPRRYGRAGSPTAPVISKRKFSTVAPANPYQFELANHAQWTVENRWFVMQHGFQVCLSERFS